MIVGTVAVLSTVKIYANSSFRMPFIGVIVFYLRDFLSPSLSGRRGIHFPQDIDDPPLSIDLGHKQVIIEHSRDCPSADA